MDAFPAFFPLAGARIVIAGSGEPAEAKARLFEGSPAVVERIDGPQAFVAGTYAGARLAFVASADDGFAQAAARAARSAGVPVNVVDRPQLCDFTTPAVIDRGEVVAAIGTGGASPMLATLLRHDIEQRVPEGAGRVAALFRLHQDEVRQALPKLNERRAFLRDALAGPAAQAALDGDMERAGELLRRALEQRSAAAGAVQYVDGSGPADLLTLRASRALAAADLLAPDAGVDPAVMAMARRDAERISPDERTPERLAALAAEGLRVLRITAGPPPAAEIEALAAAGVSAEILPVGQA
ncbi:MAG: bifunctional precorrin-2 dehydrogenase/sirohydrochlorin ferrochelatase [Phenylobacterium sp.]|uniref:precorrin-2 dehydrogenase/sirohydrochlorin ferrochelatase family protein n=1 Tax=Phenylobacterium sp. TaxID=1871053 RepID=UPI0039189E24